MASCPKCRGEMDQYGAECPHCGYDFPLAQKGNGEYRRGIAFSAIGDVALCVGEALMAIGCILAVIASVYYILTGQWHNGLVRAPIAALVWFMLFVLFDRVRKM